jgi:hypothetical protein
VTITAVLVMVPLSGRWTVNNLRPVSAEDRAVPSTTLSNIERLQPLDQDA